MAETERLSISAEFLERLIDELDSELAETLKGVLELREQRAGFRPGKKSEDARRRLRNPLLVTTYPHDRKLVLVKERLELRRKLTEAIEPALRAAMKLEAVEDELAAMEAAMAAAKGDEEVRARTGLYAGTARAVGVLFQTYGVEKSHWEAATEDDLRRIAAILLRRGPSAAA